MKKELSVNFLIDTHEGRSMFMPTNVIVYEWVRGETCMCELD